MVERGGLENRCALAYRGFESHPLRHDLSIYYYSVFQVFGGAEFATLPGGLGPMCIGPMVP